MSKFWAFIWNKIKGNAPCFQTSHETKHKQYICLQISIWFTRKFAEHEDLCRTPALLKCSSHTQIKLAILAPMQQIIMVFYSFWLRH
jgi:hypothetical protein